MKVAEGVLFVACHISSQLQSTQSIFHPIGLPLFFFCSFAPSPSLSLSLFRRLPDFGETAVTTEAVNFSFAFYWKRKGEIQAGSLNG